MKLETLWHVTVLSNFARAYDKYARRYSKAAIPESTFPKQFFLLKENELEAGISKASALLQRLDLKGDRLIALKTPVATSELRMNLRTGIGRYVERDWITLDGVAWVNGAEPTAFQPIEEVMAASLRVLHPTLAEFQDLKPRSMSVLPIARGCQASCPFCFSEASASAEQDQARLDLRRVSAITQLAKSRGAERFVITGGGEPGLLKHEQLCKLIEIGSRVLGKAVLITNAHHLTKLSLDARVNALANYAASGLRVLSISRHHHDNSVSARLMSLETGIADVVATWRHRKELWPDLGMRFVCVLQKGGIATPEAMAAYLNWATSIGVTEICFKELYVSTSIASYYHRHNANTWSLTHQVPLSLILDFATAHGFKETTQLPWGAPIFEGQWNDCSMRFSAYTEPSLLWERSHRIARSWNLMADGRCLVSLEDRGSEISSSLVAA